MPVPLPSSLPDPQALDAWFNIAEKLIIGIGGSFLTGVLFVVAMQATIKAHNSMLRKHEETLDTMQERIDPLEEDQNQTELKIARLPTREDLVTMQNQIQQQIRDSFAQMTSMLVASRKHMD